MVKLEFIKNKPKLTGAPLKPISGTFPCKVCLVNVIASIT